MWNPVDGNNLAFKTKFDLFNDSKDASATNFEFISRLLMFNRELQYGILQHNPSVYDVTIPGVGRLFMSGATINVQYKGVLRKIDDIAPYIPSVVDWNNDWSDHEVRIPDVYSVSIEFKSLLPNNLNNYLFRYCCPRDLDDVKENAMEGITTAISDHVKGMKSFQELSAALNAKPEPQTNGGGA